MANAAKWESLARCQHRVMEGEVGRLVHVLENGWQSIRLVVRSPIRLLLHCPSQRVNRLLDILCSKYRICLPILLPLSKPLVIAVVDREFFKDLLVVDNEMRVASYQGS